MNKLDKTKRENLTFEIREVMTNTVENSVKIGGYAAVFDKPSEILYNSFIERIRPGAFKKTITEKDQVMLWDHNSQYILGRRSNGTLTLEEDEIGLKFECTLPDTTYARDCMELIKRGDVKQMSFGFNVINEEWQDLEKPIQRRDILEIRLFEVSIVTFPAYADTSVSLRSLNRSRRLVSL
jgi:HK97 family phage prohead protease